MTKPNFFIVGAPKCGTTTLYEMLDQHPDICFSIEKEPLFFAKDLVGDGYISEENYLALFKDAAGAKAVGEASASYLLSKVAAESIHKFDPNARIIILLRNPVDQMLSQHGQMLFHGWENIESFEEALAAEVPRTQGAMIPNSVPVPEFLFYRRNAHFREQIERFRRLFSDTQILILTFRELVERPEEVASRTFSFLGVDASFQAEPVFANPRKVARSRRLAALLASPIVRRVGSRLLPFALRREALRLVQSVNSRKSVSADMAVQLRQELELEFEDEIDQLETLVGRPL